MGGMADVEVIELSRAEYERTVRAELCRLCLIYEQLADQARTRQFMSEDARRLWLAIGGSC
jgi:hypothetical protein